MTSLIVDASVAVKWFAAEVNADKARELGDAGNELIAPELVIAEVGNALWKKCTRGALGVDQAIASMVRLPTLFDQLFPASPLGARAIEISVMMGHPIYDCFYLALAERERLPIVTFDAKLMIAAKRLGTVESRNL